MTIALKRLVCTSGRLLIALAFAALMSAAAETAPPATVTPINIAEAIIEPFWTPELSGLIHWAIRPGQAYGLVVKQNWSAVDFAWASKPSHGPALHMTRTFNIPCAAYDRLLVRLAAPRASVVRVTAATDTGDHVFESEPFGESEAELAVDLAGATRITRVTLEIVPGVAGGASGWLRWIGLQNTALLSAYFARWDFSSRTWDAYIQDASYLPEFKPRYGIFMTPEELEERRSEHKRSLEADGDSSYARTAEAAHSMNFEAGIHEFAESGGRAKMHGRVRDAEQAPLPGGPKLAEAALVVKDAEALRCAARYALSLALSEHWEEGFMSCMPGGPWEDRAFRRSYSCQDIAVILDLAGEIFTDTGRAYLMRRLAEEGIGPINYATWRHEYIHHCNQLAYFNAGRMYAYLVLERERPRIKPYTDLAYRDTLGNLDNAILPDGGCMEGPSYFSPTVRENYDVLKHYARARGLDLARLVPERLKRTSNFAALVASTTGKDVIPICDAGPDFRGDTLDVLVNLMPHSYWVTMYNKQRLREGKEPLPREGPPLPAFVSLPEMGMMASTRTLGDQKVKLLILGHKAGADHTHEDKGSFVLEFAGETFAADLGICDYDDPIHAMYKQCQRHNMLAPVGLPERAHPQRPLPVDVKPVGQGDESTFHARIDATAGWNGYYTKWVRTWDSPSPDQLTIRDDYEIASGEGVAFYWQTQLPCTQHGRTIVIAGTRGRVTLTAPEDCAIRIETLPLHGGDTQNRIAIEKMGSAGILETVVKLTLSETE